jgi:hypothetical protein
MNTFASTMTRSLPIDRRGPHDSASEPWSLRVIRKPSQEDGLVIAMLSIIPSHENGNSLPTSLTLGERDTIVIVASHSDNINKTEEESPRHARVLIQWNVGLNAIGLTF